MTWILVIIVVVVIGGIIGYLNTGKTEDAVSGSIEFGIRCGYIFLQIFLAISGLAFLLVMGQWLFG